MSSLSASTSSMLAPQPPPPEIEATLSRLSAYRHVKGVMILSRSTPSPASANEGPNPQFAGGQGGIVQSTGAAFEGESGRRYAHVVEEIVGQVAKAVEDVDAGDELKLMRVRTTRHELIITPDERFLLVVLQDPGQ